ncbi:hypothetical protein [Roseibium aggregatum]|uniref:hypothetical protein n=1 Tax=Roseibium aggregatum TaxID=187304 RepID=UPI001A903E5E|nr:hypothetical protein [Roseibium aggregatum]MBN8181004.1 hypothetical protein [Roseibium aggregatum]
MTIPQTAKDTLKFMFPVEVLVAVPIISAIGIFVVAGGLDPRKPVTERPQSGSAPPVEHNAQGPEYGFAVSPLPPEEIQEYKAMANERAQLEALVGEKSELISNLEDSLRQLEFSGPWENTIAAYPMPETHFDTDDGRADALIERIKQENQQREKLATDLLEARETEERIFVEAKQRYEFFDTLPQKSYAQLVDLFPNADGEQSSAIVDELLKRESRATTITGDFETQMTHEEPHTAFVLVTRGRKGEETVEQDEVLQDFADATDAPEAFKVADTRTTNEVGIRLHGADFEIAPKEMIWKIIPDGHYASYDWTVVPTKEGNNKSLFIEVEQRLRIGDVTRELRVDQFPQKVEISPSLQKRFWNYLANIQTFTEAMQTILVAVAAILGLGGIGALWSWIKGRLGFGNRQGQL